MILKLNIPTGVISKHKTPKEFIDYASTCSKVLRVDPDFYDISLNQMIENNEIGKIGFFKDIKKSALNFIFNIPSDYYRLKNPKKYKI